MRLNVPSKCSKTTLSARLQPQTENFLSNFGIPLTHILKRCSTCYGHRLLILPSLHMKLYMVPTTGTGSPLLSLGVKQLYMINPSYVTCEVAKVPTHGTSAHRSIITNATTILCRKCVSTASLVPQNFVPQHCLVPYLICWNDHLCVCFWPPVTDGLL